MMDLTPLEVRKKKGDFRRSLRGYEPALVDDFLDIVADRLEQLVRANVSMSERLAQLEQQLAEFRERERALTDALVTAQTMREEMREQSSREAELTLRTAQQEAETKLRDAEQRSEQLLRDAEQNAEDRQRRLQQEVEARLRQADQDAGQLRSEAVRAREREEDAVRRLRARQQQLLSNYRNFLEREVAELNIFAETLAQGQELLNAVATPPAALEWQEEPRVSEPVAERPRAPAAAPEPIAPLVTEAAIPAEPEPAVGEVGEFEVTVAETAPIEELEPFEPEPVYEEDLETSRLQRTEPASPPAQAPLGPDDVSLQGAAPGLTESELPLDTDLGGPPPEGPPAFEPAGEADEDTRALLENAALAGYLLDLEDDAGPEAELLLDEPAEESGGDDDWLNTIFEEER